MKIISNQRTPWGKQWKQCDICCFPYDFHRFVMTFKAFLENRIVFLWFPLMVLHDFLWYSCLFWLILYVSYDVHCCSKGLHWLRMIYIAFLRDLRNQWNPEGKPHKSWEINKLLKESNDNHEKSMKSFRNIMTIINNL